MDLLCLAQIVPLPGRQTRGSLDTYAKLVILNGGTLLRLELCSLCRRTRITRVLHVNLFILRIRTW